MSISKSSTGTLLVRELMSASVITVPPATTVGQVLDLMFEKKILALPVVQDEQCIGIVTSTDLVVLLRSTDEILRSDYPHYDDCLWAVDLVQKKLDQDPVREIMSEVVMTTTPETTVAEVAEKMLEESVHHVPVVDDDGKLVGFLSSFDFLRGWSSS